MQCLTFYPQIANRILKISNFFPLSSEFHGKPGESDKNREGGRQHIKSGGLESLLLASRSSLCVFQTIVNLAVTNTSCFLGTDIRKQHHCVVVLLPRFIRILWLFLVGYI